jgi:hypothetical protein
MQKLLKCRVGRGMLESEYSIEFETVYGPVSGFVPQAKVQLSAPLAAVAEVPGAVVVQLLDENEHEGLVQLPTQLINGSDIVKVPRGLLS